MKPQSIALTVTAATAASATYMCPASITQDNAPAIMYGYKVQALLESYYGSVPVNASFFEDLPNSSIKASNGMTLAENTVTNLEGLAKQAELGGNALKMLGKELGLMPGECDFHIPTPKNGMEHLKNIFYLEATMCGAFIGLTDYIQSPEVGFVTARLSAEHGIHASAVRAMMQPVGFMANSTALTPAFTPDMVLEDGMEVGKLGTWLNGCAKAPSAPCGGSVKIGDLTATLTEMGSNSTMGANTTSSMPSPSSEPVTNDGTSIKLNIFRVLTAIAGVVLMV